MITEGDIAAAVWLQKDAAYLYAQAAEYRANGLDWLAAKVQAAAAHSAKMARQHMGIES